MCDKESQILAQDVPPGIPSSYRARADHGGVAASTLNHRALGRPSWKAKSQSQQYLTPWEEEALVKFLLQMARLGFPVRVKFVPFLAYRLTLHRPESARPTKPPHRNWTLSFRKRHPQIEARMVRALDWERHDKNIYPKITHWFEVIGEVLKDPDIKPENVWNMDETGVMLYAKLC